MAREPRDTDQADATSPAPEAQAQPAPPVPRSPSKLDTLAALLRQTEGASLPELMHATGWQAHLVRGAMAGALKARGLIITSEKIEGSRRWRAETAA
jgi:hypothetical protein